MAGGDVVAPGIERAGGAGGETGLRGARGAGRGCGGRRQLDPPRQRDGASVGDHAPRPVVDEERDWRGEGAAGAQRPGRERMMGRPAERKERLPPEVRRQPGHDPRRPAVQRIGRPVAPFGGAGEPGPEPGFARTEKEERAGAPGRAVARPGVERAEEVERLGRGPCRDLFVGGHVRRGFTRGSVERMMEPAPWSVKSSSRQAFGCRPSRITAARTPPSTAASAVSTFGIIPPEIVPSAIIPRTSSGESWVTTSPSRFFTPETS